MSVLVYDKVATPVLYLDLDGTVRHGHEELGRFVNGPDDVRAFPGMAQRLLRYREAGWRIAAVSNQGGIALGYVTRMAVYDAVDETHRQCGYVFDVAVVCPHHPDAQDEFLRACWCRKPAHGLLVEAAAILGKKNPREHYPPSLALMVGDRAEDEGCARAAGVQFMWAADWRAWQ